jgi:hypothetical protein
VLTIGEIDCQKHTCKKKHMAYHQRDAAIMILESNIGKTTDADDADTEGDPTNRKRVKVTKGNKRMHSEKQGDNTKNGKSRQKRKVRKCEVADKEDSKAKESKWQRMKGKMKSKKYIDDSDDVGKAAHRSQGRYIFHLLVVVPDSVLLQIFGNSCTIFLIPPSHH